MLSEVYDLDVLLPGGCVSDDEAVGRQGFEHFVYVFNGEVVIAEDGLFYPSGAVFEAAVPVCLAPEADKKEAGQGRKAAEDVVVKKCWFYAACPCHSCVPPLSADIDLGSCLPLYCFAEVIFVAVVRG